MIEHLLNSTAVSDTFVKGSLKMRSLDLNKVKLGLGLNIMWSLYLYKLKSNVVFQFGFVL